ncbi:MAG: S8 family serine peptidase [Myxococcota bacterium]
MPKSTRLLFGGLLSIGLFSLMTSSPLAPQEDASAPDTTRHTDLSSGPGSIAAVPISPVPFTGDRGVSVSSSTIQVMQTVQQAWIADQALIRPTDAASLERILATWPVDLIRDSQHSGLAVVTVPDGLEASEFIDALGLEGLIAEGAMHGRIVGASAERSLVDMQWHLGTADVRSDTGDDALERLNHYTVAVLDTGVAYQDDGRYRAAPSLLGSTIVAPHDFVNGDGQAYDDHQHGTHIASVIASNGSVQGVAPGVSLMPLKVLDENNSGYEIDLIEAIYHAVDNGADVINMSLSFGLKYVPSAALLDALDYADKAGVIMVAASGNDGAKKVAWPARSPMVIAVGGRCDVTLKDHNGQTWDVTSEATYANTGPALDLTAPSGCLDQDLNSDGRPDGIIAESISLQRPEQIGYWAYAGTSQAAAMVSGTVARMLADGVPPQDITAVLHKGAEDPQSHWIFNLGLGIGALDVYKTHQEIEILDLPDNNTDDDDDDDNEGLNRLHFGVSMMPYLRDNGDGTVSPSAQIHLVETEGRNYQGQLFLRLMGDTDDDFSCYVSNFYGQCDYIGDPVPALVDGVPAPLVWQFSVEALVTQENSVYRPERMIYGSPELESAVSAMGADPSTQSAILGFHWLPGDSDLGPLAESFMAVDTGTGIATSPFGVLMTPPAILPTFTATALNFGTNGTGIATSPFTIQLLQLPPFDPVRKRGLKAFPSGMNLATLDGTGIATSPFGPIRVLTPPMPGPVNPGITQPIMLGSGLIGGVPAEQIADSALAAKIADGGWVSLDGHQVASSIAASSLYPAIETNGSSSTGAAPIDP